MIRKLRPPVAGPLHPCDIIQTDEIMELGSAIGLIEGLENSPGLESTYRPSVEQAISGICEKITCCSEQEEELRLKCLEYRAYVILYRWQKLRLN